MTHRIVCAACGKPRGEEDDLTPMPECVGHKTCARCERFCWFWNDRACADSFGGWREVLATERARVASVTEERDRLASDVRALETTVELLERELRARMN